MQATELHTIRKKRNLTQTQLANKLGVNLRTIQNYEKGNQSIPLYIEKALKYEFNLYTPTSSVNQDKRGKPYYDVDFIGGFDVVLNDQTIQPDYYIDFAPFNDVDCWVNITGNSMSPLISHGDIVGLKRMQNWREFILFGEIYAIVTEEYRTIKVVSKGDTTQHIKLIPYNHSPEFVPQDLPTKLITHFFRVQGSIKKFF